METTLFLSLILFSYLVGTFIGYQNKYAKEKALIEKKEKQDAKDNELQLKQMSNSLIDLIESDSKFEILKCSQGAQEINGIKIYYYGAAFYFLLLENIKAGNIDVKKLEDYHILIEKQIQVIRSNKGGGGTYVAE